MTSDQVDIEEYVRECFRQKKKVSGRKISGQILDFSKLYCEAIGVVRPKCEVCEKPCEFLNQFRGFRKYCGIDCYRLSMSKRNSDTNDVFNKIKGADTRLKYECKNKFAAEYYIRSSVTISEAADKFGTSKGLLNEYLKAHDLIDRKRSAALVVARRDTETLKFARDKLSSLEYVKNAVESGFTGKMISDSLQCSPNFVHTTLRSLYDENPLQGKCGSSYENIVCEILNGQNIIRRNRSIIRPYELDLYLPDKNIAIEVNGIYWHSDKHKPKMYHSYKTDLCEAAGVRLIHITDFEIDTKLDIVSSMLNSAVGNNNTIYARKTNVVKIPSRTFRDFCSLNHIQGAVNSSIRYGLMHDGALVAVMGFSKPRFSNKYDLELTRYASLLNTNIVGGASKLLNAFKNDHVCNTVVSYANRSYFSGKMYSKLGFELLHKSAPNYQWIHPHGKILSRYQTMKHKLDTSLTENEYMTNEGFHKIYDSGNNTYVWNL